MRSKEEQDPVRVIQPRKLLRPTSCCYYAFRIPFRLFGFIVIFGVTFYRTLFIFGSIRFFSHFHPRWIFLRVSTVDGGNTIEVSRKRPKEVYSRELMQRCYRLMLRRSEPQQYFTHFFVYYMWDSRVSENLNFQIYSFISH